MQGATQVENKEIQFLGALGWDSRLQMQDAT
jgi:hypothetical protein